MKKLWSQISIGIVCILLGFMITYQFKMISKQSLVTDTDKNSPEILMENEQLKKSKEELKKKIDELNAKTKEYENVARGRDEQSELLYKELEETRILTGGTEVEGKGLIIYITPKSNIFGSSAESQRINDSDLVHIVNELNAADAEAISINDIRLTSRSGIRNAGNAIIINDEKVSYNKRITIKVIGRQDILEGAMSFSGAIPQNLMLNCDISTEKSDKIKIEKYNKTYKFEYAKPIEKK
ncbi:DUF881 domain-containing protein [Clostridium sp. CS001]|uniref:DUF881 domain-containing protein n=1 Tax=Clostridium sp. CS001 TaxID=2880648 RepID=UPI001CF27F15|nr:DUF881 domain-containing protein [Clostridium sp. CS001]MCB2288910.1 DUF881 domain-containing protein [Clostridium sp. CS001]